MCFVLLRFLLRGMRKSMLFGGFFIEFLVGLMDPTGLNSGEETVPILGMLLPPCRCGAWAAVFPGGWGK